MVESSSLNAERIARYEFEHGTLAVEKFLDAVLSVKEHFALPAPRRRKASEEEILQEAERFTGQAPGTTTAKK